MGCRRHRVGKCPQDALRTLRRLRAKRRASARARVAKGRRWRGGAAQQTRCMCCDCKPLTCRANDLAYTSSPPSLLLRKTSASELSYCVALSACRARSDPDQGQVQRHLPFASRRHNDGTPPARGGRSAGAEGVGGGCPSSQTGQSTAKLRAQNKAWCTRGSGRASTSQKAGRHLP